MWGAAMDVGEWLKGVGLGQYETNFRDNKIDVDALAELTDGDLGKLGLPLGECKRLLKAIAGRLFRLQWRTGNPNRPYPHAVSSCAIDFGRAPRAPDQKASTAPVQRSTSLADFPDSDRVAPNRQDARYERCRAKRMAQ
jgi:hypothetical protein